MKIMNSATVVITNIPSNIAELNGQASRCPFHRLAASTETLFLTIKKALHLKTSKAPINNHKKHGVPSSEALRCPMGHGSRRNESVFIEHAQNEAAAAPVLVGDPEANLLLEAARSAIYHWPVTFNGFRATLRYSNSNRIWESEIIIRSSRDYEFALLDCPDEKWVKFQLEELIAHREAPQKSRMASQTGVFMGDNDEIYGQKVIFAGDKMKSYYRLQNNKITQIHRAYSGQSFVINIDKHAEHNGKYAATCYTAFYSDGTSGEFKKVETYLDSYSEVEGILLPSERRFSEATAKALCSRSLSLINPTLLPL